MTWQTDEKEKSPLNNIFTWWLLVQLFVVTNYNATVAIFFLFAFYSTRDKTGRIHASLPRHSGVITPDSVANGKHPVHVPSQAGGQRITRAWLYLQFRKWDSSLIQSLTTGNSGPKARTRCRNGCQTCVSYTLFFS